MDRLFKIHASDCHKIMANGVGSVLSAGAKTFLREWYANDTGEIHSKYLWKGIEKEDENIDFAARVLGYGLAAKNTVTASDEYMIGTCDIEFPDCICDVKTPWNRKTFLDNINGANADYLWQGRVYMRLYNKDKFILFYGLLNTPETDYEPEVVFEDAPDNERWIAYQIKRDEAIEKEIIKRVIQCREYLDAYDKEVKSKLAQVHEII